MAHQFVTFPSEWVLTVGRTCTSHPFEIVIFPHLGQVWFGAFSAWRLLAHLWFKPKICDDRVMMGGQTAHTIRTGLTVLLIGPVGPKRSGFD